MRRIAYYAKVKRDPERLAKLRAAKREQARRRRERAKTDPAVAESIRRATKKQNDKKRADPEVWQDKLIDQRIRYRDTADPRFRHVVVAEAFVDDEDFVPIAPFTEWLAATFGDCPPEEFALLVGHSIDRFQDQFMISLGVVDRVVTYGLGRPDLLESLYPFDIYRAGTSRKRLGTQAAA